MKLTRDNLIRFVQPSLYINYGRKKKDDFGGMVHSYFVLIFTIIYEQIIFYKVTYAL